MVLMQKLRIAALQEVFDLKWSRAHAGHGQTKDGEEFCATRSESYASTQTSP